MQVQSSPLGHIRLEHLYSLLIDNIEDKQVVQQLMREIGEQVITSGIDLQLYQSWVLYCTNND